MKEDEARALLAQYREARRIGDPAAIAKARLDFRALAVPPEVSTEIERREIDEKLAAAIDALPADAGREAIVAAANVIGPADWAILTDPPPGVVPSDKWRNEPEPPPVLWRDAEGQFCDSLVAAGEVAVLAGAGKSGKSFLALGLVVEAARALREGLNYGATCGLRVRAGRSILLSFEDSPKRIDMRAEAMGGEPGDVLLVPCPTPLFGPHPTNRTWGELPKWEPAWRAVRKASPSLVVVDTGPKMMGGEMLDTGAVIGLLQGIERETQDGGFAALVVAHDTKAARRAAMAGDPVEDAVAGSSQWHDSTRGVLHLTKMGRGDADRLLECIKASYGRDGWGARLRPRYAGRRYAGLELVEQLDEAGVAAAREAMKPAAPSKGESEGGNGRSRRAVPKPEGLAPGVAA